MRSKGLILLFVLLVVVGVCAIGYFITRPPQQVEILPQKFAQLPQKAKLIAEFYHGPSIYSVAFSPTDSSLIASADRNGTIRLWNIDQGKEEIRTFGHPDLSATIGFSPDGKMLAGAGRTLILWDIDTGQKVITLDTSSNEFAFSPDGNLLATISERESEKHQTEVKIWDIRNLEKISEIGNLPFSETHKATGWPCTVDISSDGKWIAAGYSNGTINVWDLQTRQLVKTLESSMHRMGYLKFSPHNKYMVAGGGDIETYSAHSVKGYIMWELPSWQRKGEVLRGHVENLEFSPNEKVCVSADPMAYAGRGIEFWSVESGVPITSLPTLTRDVSFSHDGRLLVSGNNDGFVQVWELNYQQLELTEPHVDVVRIVYFLPKNKEIPPNIVEKLDISIRNVQEFYADEMERHGFGRKTFSYETDENGKVKVYLIKEDDIEYYDLFSANVKFLYPTRDGNLVKGIEGIKPGRIVYALVTELNHKSLAYILRDALGIPYSPLQYERNSLKRFFLRIHYKMPWSEKRWKLSKCQAEWLDKCRFFNPNQPFFDKRPEIELTIVPEDTEDSRLFQFTVADEDGVHQVQLFVPSNLSNQWRINIFQECHVLHGKDNATVVFEISDPKIMKVKLRMIDMLGNISMREFRIKEKSDEK